MSVVRHYTTSVSQYGRSDIPPLHIRLEWNAEDPYAVQMTFPRRPELDPWMLSRDLLEQGLSGPVGVGDVRCCSEGDGYTITLAGSGKQADMIIHLGLRTGWVSEFLRATTVSDPELFGEYLDWELARILDGEVA